MNDESVRDVCETECCIVGGGPAGVVLSLLLARRGVEVVLLESHQDFDREFRGDTLHPAVLEIMDEIGMASRLHKLPHVKVYGPVLRTSRGLFRPFDLRRLKTKFPYIMFMHQPLFLECLAAEARKYRNFRLIMGADVRQLVEEDGVVRGVRYRAGDGWHEIRAVLTVGADGRFSRMRHLADIEPIPTSQTLELLQFRLPVLPDDPMVAKLKELDWVANDGSATDAESPVFPMAGPGRLVPAFKRPDHWQLWYFFPPGQYKPLRDAGLAALRDSILELEPAFEAHFEHLKDWEQITMLSVASSRCRRWHKPGLLLIGDAAHAMTPAAGAGIKYAIEDAVVAANILAEPLKSGHVEQKHLEAVQRRREWPTRLIQLLSAFAVKRILGILSSNRPPRLPLFARLLLRTPIVRILVPRFVGIGFRQVHVE